MWVWNQSQVDAYSNSIKHKLNLMSSQAPPRWHFLLHFSIFYNYHSSYFHFFFPLHPPTIACRPSLSFSFWTHFSASIFSSRSFCRSLSLHPKQQPFQKKGHQSSSMRPECERVPRLQQITISPYLHSTLDNIRRRGWADREREGESEREAREGREPSRRNNLT